MNPAWDAAQALLALVQECLDADCTTYTRQYVETGNPVADCNTLAVVIGSARAFSGSCVGKIQLPVNLDVTLIRCCEPVGELSEQGGYSPPSVEALQAAVACIVRDAWQVYTCLACNGCEALGAVPGVTACCDKQTGSPEIIWGSPSGGCRSAIVRIPIILTVCCPSE